jgi:2-phospho-L-lactate guanylyltransferase
MSAGGELWALVPLKRFGTAKGRLAPLLSGAERASLTRAMADDVLAALAAAPCVTRMAVVTADPAAVQLAEERDAEALPETASGLVGALVAAVATLREAGCRHLCILPGDVPRVHGADLERLWRIHGCGRHSGRVTLVPDARGRGTNALLLSPPGAIPLCYGPDSAPAHLAAALAAGLATTSLAVPGLALDVDTPEDLLALQAAGDAPASVAFLESSGIASRLRGATGRGA